MRLPRVSANLVLGLGAVCLAAPAGIAHATAQAVSVDDFVARTYDDGKGHVLPYRLFVPRGTDPKKSYPLVMFLHGSGGRGRDNRRQLTDQAAPLVFAEPANQAKWPVFMLAPQCPPDQKWVDMPWDPKTGKGTQPAQPTWPMAAAIALVDQLAREFPASMPSDSSSRACRWAVTARGTPPFAIRRNGKAR